MLGTIEVLGAFATGVVAGLFLADYEVLTADHVRRATRYSVDRTRSYLNGTDLVSVTQTTMPGKSSGPIGFSATGIPLTGKNKNK